MKRLLFLASLVFLCCAVKTAEEPLPKFREGSGELAELPLPDAEAFTTKDNKKGWRIKIPGNRPLATPAVAGDVLYVGGGFGSHEFYALDTKTGKRVWSYKTGDDGPTAAVVAEDCVAYNTESCTLYVHDAKSGRLHWSKWLGDPLMSQPAISNGKLFMAYPGGGTHHLVAFELKTGKVLWDQKIKAEVITAPVLDAESCYAATVDGTLYHFDAATGKEHFSIVCNATSAPVIVEHRPYFSQRVVRDIEVADAADASKKVTSQSTLEGFNSADPKTGELGNKEAFAAIKAAYLMTSDTCRTSIVSNGQSSVAAQGSARFGARSAEGVLAGLNIADSGTGGRNGGGGGPKAESVKIADLSKRLTAYKAKPLAASGTDGVKDAEEALALADDLDKVGDRLEISKAPEDKRKEVRDAAKLIRENAAKTKEASETVAVAEKNLKSVQTEAAEAQKHDASVAFATAPADAKLNLSAGNLGQQNVKSVWAYQGSRPLLYNGNCISLQGERFRSVKTGGEALAWDNTLASKVDATRPATPPALAGGKLYVGTADGRIVCSDPESGKTLWESEVGGNILFQPAIAGGRVFAATNDGTLICVETGDATADGWTMWGGSASHNGAEKK
jgi:outer membrane protein assembly factor BamB